MAERADEQVDTQRARQPVAPRKSVADLKAEIRNTRTRLAATVDQTAARVPLLLNGPLHGAAARVGEANILQLLRQAGGRVRSKPALAGAALAGTVATVGVLSAVRHLRSRRAEARRRIPGPPSLGRLSAILLDLDGTLIDSNAAHAETWAEALREHGFAYDAAQVRPLIGMGGDKLLPALAGVDEDSPEGRAIVERKKALFTARVPQLVPTRGVRELVSYLRGRRKTVVIATSADDQEMRVLLERAGVADLIPRGTSKDDAARSKPDPDIVRAALRRAGSKAGRTVLIGDTPYDIEAAHRAGIESIALRSGGHWPDLEFDGATAIFDDPSALLAHWRQQ
jgi:HAD superfamily hydrolase (TIGR01509 family)